MPQIIRQCKLSATVALTLVQYVTHSGPEVLFKTCVTMEFMDDDDELSKTFLVRLKNLILTDVCGNSINHSINHSICLYFQHSNRTLGTMKTTNRKV